MSNNRFPFCVPLYAECVRANKDLLNWLKNRIPDEWTIETNIPERPHFLLSAPERMGREAFSLSVCCPQDKCCPGDIVFETALISEGRLHYRRDWDYDDVRTFSTKEEVLAEIIRLHNNPHVDIDSEDEEY